MRAAKRLILAVAVLITFGVTQAHAAPALCTNKDGTLSVHSRCPKGQKQFDVSFLQGPKGPTGVTGAAGVTGKSAPIIFSANCSALGTTPGFLFPEGTTSITVNPSNAELVMPVGCVAQNLTVHIGTAPGGSGNSPYSRFLGVGLNGNYSTGLGCTILGFNQDCSGGSPLTLIPGDRISIYSQTDSNVPTDAVISFECQ